VTHAWRQITHLQQMPAALLPVLLLLLLRAV
jgi:hypothetical protein